MFRILFNNNNNKISNQLTIALRKSIEFTKIQASNNNDRHQYNLIRASLYSSSIQYRQLHKQLVGQQNRIPRPTYKKESSDKISPFGWFLLLIPLTTLGLGCWQVQRKKWKESLIHRLASRMSTPPIEIPEDILELQSMEYYPVKVRGQFLNDQEMYIGPRSLIGKSTDDTPKSGLFSQQDSSIGYLVVTPFQLEDRSEIILINRGWVPRAFKKPETRQQGQLNKTVEFVGIVRKGETRPVFMPDIRSEFFQFRDVYKMCELTNAKPIFLDANAESTVPGGGPIGGQTQVMLRNEHLSYIFTWFSLSALTSILWYQQIIKKRKPF